MEFYFIKKIANNKVDELCHRQFIRFGKGKYENRALLNVTISAGKIKVHGSFETLNDIIAFLSSLTELNVSGKILFKKNDDVSILQRIGLTTANQKTSTVIEVETQGKLEKNKGIELQHGCYFMLLDVDSPGILLKCKKKLPKPSAKSTKTTNDKFFSLELTNAKAIKAFLQEFLFDVDTANKKKINITHNYIINDIILPKTASNAEEMRQKAKRKGVIERVVKADGTTTIKKINFIA